MKKTYPGILCLLTIACLGLLGAGCGKTVTEKAAEKAVEKATNGQANVNVSTNSATVNFNGGSVHVGEAVGIPASFPDDVYVIDGTIKAATTITEGQVYGLTIETTKSVTEAVALYNTNLANEGWTIAYSATANEASTLMAQKDKRTVTIGISTTDGKTTVVISTGVNP
jgi:Neuraminidase (sialidase)